VVVKKIEGTSYLSKREKNEFRERATKAISHPGHSLQSASIRFRCVATTIANLYIVTDDGFAVLAKGSARLQRHTS